MLIHTRKQQLDQRRQQIESSNRALAEMQRAESPPRIQALVAALRRT